MIQIGIRLHDVNTTKDRAFWTLEERAKTAREEGFSCVHLALSKVISGVAFDEAGAYVSFEAGQYLDDTST